MTSVISEDLIICTHILLDCSSMVYSRLSVIGEVIEKFSEREKNPFKSCYFDLFLSLLLANNSLLNANA